MISLSQTTTLFTSPALEKTFHQNNASIYAPNHVLYAPRSLRAIKMSVTSIHASISMNVVLLDPKFARKTISTPMNVCLTAILPILRMWTNIPASPPTVILCVKKNVLSRSVRTFVPLEVTKSAHL